MLFSLPTPRQNPLAAGLLIALASLCSCSQDEPVVDSGATPRTITTAAEREWTTGDYELVARFEIPEDPEAWNMHATRREVIQAPEPKSRKPALQLAAAKRKYVDIPLPEDLGEFNRVTMKLVMKAHSSVWATLLRDGKSVCETPYATVLGRRYAQELSIDIPSARVLRQPPDTLRLSFAGGARQVQCWDFAVWSRPWESWAAELSAPDHRPVLKNVSRPGAVVASDNGRSGRLDVPAAGTSFMTFYYGNAPRLSHPRRPARLSVRLTSPSRSESFEYDLPRGKDVEDAWTAARVDLSAWAGESVEVDVALDSEPGQ